MNTREVRQSFLDFFADREHRRYDSAPLVPQGDPTLLFVNAGMVPFKDFFLGVETPPQPRAVSSQKCLRVSGKHNDLENVGPSSRHHTFFEMLGNFSFGDYFKAGAIEFAWQLVTDVWGLNPDHLFASVYEEDDDAHELWSKISTLPREHIVRCGKADNFWAMGDVGPCGPCSEIHVDRTPDLPQVPWEEGSSSGRYSEIWNLVFMQFESDASGQLRPLPNPSIDTGAGLERVSAVLQGVDSNYDTDLFQPILMHAADLAGATYGCDPAVDVSLRVVADHLRAVAFLLADGVIPSNEGRGYVLRRILRRAVRHGMHLGLEEPFLHRLLPTLGGVMSSYPELSAAERASQGSIKTEEEKFLSTVTSAARHVQDAIETSRQEGRRRLDGETVFRLYDTYGLPPEMLREIAEEEGFELDDEGFKRALDVQRRRSRRASSRAQELSSSLRSVLSAEGELPIVAFVGYGDLELEGAIVLRLARLEAEGDFSAVESLSEGEKGALVTDSTPFYPEGGGQVGDRGTADSQNAKLEILDTQKDGSGLIFHAIEVEEGEIGVGDSVRMRVDEERRRQTERNHTATHLLHAALRQRLGDSVRQAGSLVHPDRLRFDFTHDRPLTEDDRRCVQDLMAEWVRRAVPTKTGERAYNEAVEAGAMALFGEKYGDRVRTVEIPGFSLELCGGCHVGNTGEIGGIRLLGERGVASGVRRIEAVTGRGADELAYKEHELLCDVEGELGVPIDSAAGEIAALKARLKEAEKEISKLRLQLLSGGEEGADEVEVEGVKVVSREVAAAPSGELRNMADILRDKLGSGIVVLGARSQDRVNLVVSVSADLTGRVKAGALARRMGSLVGGNGGGRADFAQAGGKDPALLPGALTAVASAVEDELRAQRG